MTNRQTFHAVLGSHTGLLSVHPDAVSVRQRSCSPAHLEHENKALLLLVAVTAHHQFIQG